MLLPISILFFPLLVLNPLPICSHMWVRRWNIKPLRKSKRRWTIKIRTYSGIDMRLNVSMSAESLVLAQFGWYKGLLWEDPLLSDNIKDGTWGSYSNPFCTLKPNQLHWVLVCQKQVLTLVSYLEMSEVQYTNKQQWFWKCLGELMLPL